MSRFKNHWNAKEQWTTSYLLIRWCLELHWRSFINFYFEFEYRKHRTIKRDAESWVEDAKVPLRCYISFERHFAHTWTLIPAFSVGVGSSDTWVWSSDPTRSCMFLPMRGARPANLAGVGSSGHGVVSSNPLSEVSCSLRQRVQGFWF